MIYKQKASGLLTSHNKFHITLGLDRIKKILSILNNPQENYKIIHIAGTNGKGSTSKIINDILIEHFKQKKQEAKIGLYTSPHLFSYTERIKINNIDIADYTFDKLVEKIDKLALANNIELSEFELLSAVAFYYFYIKRTDYVILETGLGGRFDATNIIKAPLVSVITTIDYDHTERLGDTIEKIALEKAGIIKQGSKIVVSKENKGYEVIKNKALELKAQLIEPVDITNIINSKKYSFNLSGAHQKDNLSLALAAINEIIKPDDKTLQKALKNVKWKFRLEYDKKKNILIDCAHNPSGVEVLRKFLDENFKDSKKTFIFGCLKNKDYKKMLDVLIKPDDEFYFFEFDYPNALKFDELGHKDAIKIADIKEIKKLIKEKDNLKIFCGSIYMLGMIFREF